MSRVLLIAADKPLPLCNLQEERASVTGRLTISIPRGFLVGEHSYYRRAVDELGYPMKPYQYELSLESSETDLLHLKEYLTEQFAPHDAVELWSVWVDGSVNKKHPPHYSGALENFDLETMDQLLNPGEPSGECWLTITL